MFIFVMIVGWVTKKENQRRNNKINDELVKSKYVIIPFSTYVLFIDLPQLLCCRFVIVIIEFTYEMMIMSCVI